MYVLNISSAIKTISVNEMRDFILETILNELDFLRKTVIIQRKVRKKDLLLLATKLIEKLPDPHNT